MTPNLQNKETQLLSSVETEQMLTLMLPFEPKITSKTKIEASLNRLLAQAEQRLFQQLQKKQARMVLAQINTLVAALDFSTHKKSLVLTATPHEGKRYYWNIPVQEAILLSNEFPVRQLLARKKEEREYLLLAMGDHTAGIFLGNDKQLTRLVANSPAPVNPPVVLDAASTPESICRSELQRSVRHIDDALTILLRSYHFPVFIAAPAANVECFRQISRNQRHIAAFIEGNTDCSQYGLQQLMAPKLASWQAIKEKALLQQLDHALQNGKLAVGMSEVWAAAADKRGRLLVVEADYIFPAYLDAKEGILYADTIPIDQMAHPVSDAVAKVIEKVLADGGIVEVVGKGALAGYVHIAMTCY